MNRRLWLVLAALPLVAFAAAYIILQYPVWTAPNALWIVSTSPDEPLRGTCETLDALRVVRAERVYDETAARVDRAEADKAGLHAVRQAAVRQTIIGRGEPILVRAALGETLRLAWVVSAALEQERAGIVMLDATTGVPLSVIISPTTRDPASCPLDLRNMVVSRASLPALIGLLVYGLMLLVGVAVLRLRGRKG